MPPSRPANFTVRDLNRRPAEVLAAAMRLGRVVIRSRRGEAYELKPVAAASVGERLVWPDFQARHRSLGMPVMTPAQRAQLDRLIAGED